MYRVRKPKIGSKAVQPKEPPIAFAPMDISNNVPLPQRIIEKSNIVLEVNPSGEFMDSNAMVYPKTSLTIKNFIVVSLPYEATMITIPSAISAPLYIFIYNSYTNPNTVIINNQSFTVGGASCIIYKWDGSIVTFQMVGQYNPNNLFSDLKAPF